jgi:hypothetical protein
MSTDRVGVQVLMMNSTKSRMWRPSWWWLVTRRRPNLRSIQHGDVLITLHHYRSVPWLFISWLKVVRWSSRSIFDWWDNFDGGEGFCWGVLSVFGGSYLRCPTVQDAKCLLKIGERWGFPGMFGSIDYMHWQWERCPTAWKGQFTWVIRKSGWQFLRPWHLMIYRYGMHSLELQVLDYFHDYSGWNIACAHVHVNFSK